MNKIFFSIFIIIGGCSVNNSNINQNKLPNIPLEDFFKNPEKSSFQLSPNGEYISYMKPWEDGNRRMNVYVKPINSDNFINVLDVVMLVNLILD